jgi:two-component system response regulator PhoP
MRALVAEDDPQLLTQIRERLEAAGFVVDAAADGRDGLHMALEHPLDVAVIDLGMPTVSGMELIYQAREAGCAYPILILTARDGWQAKVEGLEAGADDYLLKPFHHEELLARLRALLRRAAGWSRPALQSGPVTLDPAAHSVALAGEPVELTAFEYRVLEYLLFHAGRVIPKSELIEHLYPDDAERDSNVLEVYIRRLRHKLDPSRELHPIETRRGQGYRWRLPREAGR